VTFFIPRQSQQRIKTLRLCRGVGQPVLPVGTGTCDGKSGEKSEPIVDVYQLSYKLMNNFSNKNQKDKEQFFIFLMKKPRWLYDEN
jgi:hypothetical protein